MAVFLRSYLLYPPKTRYEHTNASMRCLIFSSFFSAVRCSSFFCRIHVLCLRLVVYRPFWHVLLILLLCGVLTPEILLCITHYFISFTCTQRITSFPLFFIPSLSLSEISADPCHYLPFFVSCLFALFQKRLLSIRMMHSYMEFLIDIHILLMQIEHQTSSHRSPTSVQLMLLQQTRPWFRTINIKRVLNATLSESGIWHDSLWQDACRNKLFGYWF